jgi:hypothetical protein
MDKLTPHLRPSDAIADSEVDKLIDKSLHATLSLYIPAEKLGGLFKNWTRQKRLELRDNYEQTKELRQAIDPLFNDIAIRDTNSTIDEFLIDVEGADEVENIVITLPQRLRWETEGKHFAVNLGAPVSHELKCRMFWYAHTDGALSYHISFFMNYAHMFEDYYFLSMFQKLMFPKEFYIPKSADRSQLTPEDITSGNTGLWPLDEKLVSALVDYADPFVWGTRTNILAVRREALCVPPARSGQKRKSRVPRRLAHASAFVDPGRPADQSGRACRSPVEPPYRTN